MRIITIVGARPQFIKAAILSRALRGCHEEILIHTGQHFDANMSTVFFDELEISAPKYNLGISGETHGVMTGKMLIAIEEVLVRERPDAVLLYGDTNSTVAGALAAVKLRIPLIHVEAWEQARDAGQPGRGQSDYYRSSFDVVVLRLGFRKVVSGPGGPGSRAYTVGNVMYDAFLYFGKRAAEQKRTPVDYNSMPISMPDRYCYLTCHRAENTSDEALTEIFRAVSSLDYPTIYPVHPRNRERARESERVSRR